MKMNFSTILLFIYSYSSGQLNFPTPVFDAKAFSFRSTAASKLVLTETELKDFVITDTIKNPYGFIISNTYSLYIAIKNDATFDVYELLTRYENLLSGISEIDTISNTAGSIKLKIPGPTAICKGYLRAGKANRIRLDKFGNSELILEFSYHKSCCPTCAIPLNSQNYEGLIIFDFDKLHVLDLTTRSSIRYTNNGTGIKDRPIEFEKNYLKTGRWKYYYKDNLLVRK